jgi:bifunctional UDP-N-acetylglucosamine pyrophosphorylase/glucosamine-1-phosphate N-acetyltransferase
MSSPELVAVVLAAGQGKRMKSQVPKVLHAVAGRPLVHYPVAAAVAAGASRVCVVVSPGVKEPVERHLAARFSGVSVTTAIQEVARGTGDAARVGLDGLGGLDGESHVLILCGDTPLVGAADLSILVDALRSSGAGLALLGCELPDPAGYGRILRDPSGTVTGVREDRDLAPDMRSALREVNAGVYAARVDVLREGLSRLDANNSQGELYLTDVVAFAAGGSGAVGVVGNPDALLGVNDRRQLHQAEELLYARIAERHRLAGVTVRGASRIDDAAVIAPDVTIGAGVELRGSVVIGAGALVDTGCVVVDSSLGEGCRVKPYSVVEESEIGARAEIGPFARVRPGSAIGDEAHVGNFVETKKTRLGKGAKANHLAYLGDGDVGAGANIGAGTIFCNYDGFKKHVTTIGEGAFIGSDSQLVAPVTVGKGAYVATGTTVTRDVPDDALAISRTKQDNKAGYASRIKARLAAAKKG